MALSTSEFGQRIKQKYPEYSDMSDEELGSKMLQKYPQYKDMVNSSQPTNQNSQAQSPKYSIGGFASNVVKDVGDNIKGIASIPKAVGYVAQDPIHRVPQAGLAVGKGIIDEYKNLIKDPVNTAYNKPVSTAMDVLSVIDPALKLTNAGKAGKAAEEIGKAGEVLSGAEKALPLKESTVTSAIDKLNKASDTSKSLDYASSMFSNLFTVPTKRAKELQPLETAKKMVEYGVTGNMERLKNVTQAVTGDNGILTRITRSVLPNKEIDIGNVADAVKESLDKSLEVSDRDVAKIVKEIQGKQPKVSSQGIGPEGMKQAYNINATDAFDLARDLEKKGHQYLNHNTYLSSNQRNIDLGSAYLNAADQIKNSIEKSVKSAGIIDKYKTPDVISALEKISPKLAEDFTKAKSIADLRKLQAPFVKLSKMIDLTEQSGRSAAAKAGSSVMSKIVGAGGGAVLGGPVGAVAGTVIAPMAEPFIKAAVDSIQGPVVTNAAQAVNKIGPTVGKAANITGNAFRKTIKGLTNSYSLMIERQLNGVSGQ